jgi:hypothetical protein
MGIPADLAPKIVEQLEGQGIEGQGCRLYIGPLPLARALHEAIDEPLLVFNDRLKLSKLAKLTDEMVVLRAAPHQLPVADGCVSALVVADVVSQLPLDLLEGISTWRRSLQPNGSLLLIERLRRSLGGVLARRTPTEPEDLTGAMLNAGFSGIGQHFYGSSWVLTRGRRLVLPGEQA